MANPFAQAADAASHPWPPWCGVALSSCRSAPWPLVRRVGMIQEFRISPQYFILVRLLLISFRRFSLSHRSQPRPWLSLRRSDRAPRRRYLLISRLFVSWHVFHHHSSTGWNDIWRVPYHTAVDSNPDDCSRTSCWPGDDVAEGTDGRQLTLNASSQHANDGSQSSVLHCNGPEVADQRPADDGTDAEGEQLEVQIIALIDASRTSWPRTFINVSSGLEVGHRALNDTVSYS